MGKGRGRLVGLIGVFKLVKAAALITLGVAALVALPDRLADGIARAVACVGVFPGRVNAEHALGKLRAMDPSKAKELGLLALGYAAIFIVEGIGLLLGKRWAEWLTVVVTTSFIPIEIYELAKHASGAKAVTLALNVAIVGYLVWRRVEERRGVAAHVGRALRRVA